MNTPQPEDRRFFIGQYLRTMPLNILSMGIKVLNGLAWTILDSASVLGAFSLASTPSAISQRAMIAGSISQTILPATKNKDQDEAIIQAAIFIDCVLVLLFLVLLAIFFLVTRAAILNNLGLLFFLGVALLSVVEPFCGGAVSFCYAKRHYGWNFMLNNIRPLFWMLMIFCFAFTKSFKPSNGIWLWIFSSLTAFILSLIYFSLQKVKFWPIRRDPSGSAFTANLFASMHHLIFYKLTNLLFGSMISLYISFLSDTHEVGLFSFAMTISGFMYAAIAPINEQIYSPSLSRLVNENNHSMLLRRLIQMSTITLLMVLTGSLFLYFGGRPLLILVHKMAFLESFTYLPVLLWYQALVLINAGFSYALFSMHRYKALSIFQLSAFLAAGAWYLMFKSTMSLSLWCLPFSIVVYAAFTSAYVTYLVLTKKTLLRRSMANFI